MAEPDITTVIRSYKYKLLPSKRQHRILAAILESQRLLYNDAKMERDDCYRKTGKYLNYQSQCRSLTEARGEIAACAQMGVSIQRWTLKRLDCAYKRFFQRKGTRRHVGFPRYKSKNRWHSFGFREPAGFSLRGGRLRFKGMASSLRIHKHRTMPNGKMLSCVITRDAKGWSVCFGIAFESARLPQAETATIGVDLGLNWLCSLSDGTTIENPRFAKQMERAIRLKSRAIARGNRGSLGRKKKRRALDKLHLAVKNARRTYLHTISKKLVTENGLICIENIIVSGLARSYMAGSIYDAAWSTLRQFITYKAEGAGRVLVVVNPRQTSQICPDCGQIAKKKLSQRVHRCGCGRFLDRDHAAAKVILARGRSGPRVRQRKAAA